MRRRGPCDLRDWLRPDNITAGGLLHPLAPNGIIIGSPVPGVDQADGAIP